jgi:hypothetical protein
VHRGQRARPHRRHRRHRRHRIATRRFGVCPPASRCAP